VGTRNEQLDPTIQYHPRGWADCTLSLNHHAFQARRSLMACVSCHQEGDCIRCHNAGGGACGGGLYLSPHKHLTGGQLEAIRRRNPAMCAKCHTTGGAP